MSFSSYSFLFLFLPLAIVGFRIGRNHGWADLWLIAVSILFYWFAGAAALIVVVSSAITNYWFSNCLERSKRTRVRAHLLAGAIVTNVLVLAYFKYFSYFVHSIAGYLNIDVAVPDPSLPLGISFYTFQQIAYLLDMYVKEAPPPRFRDYLLFVTFFPQASAGPINYWHETIPQYRGLGPKNGTALDISVGLTLFAFGLFKKIVLASPLGSLVDPVFDQPSRALGIVDAWTAALAYVLQLYFDFSGYSDMAIGIARMFGVRLPINFNSPFKATNLVDFWRSWHMTMTRFFTDYVYSPLSLHWSRQSLLRHDPRNVQFVLGVALPILVTLLLIGWWHGPQWTYVLFGAIHGVGLVVNHGWRQLKLARLPRLLGWAATFGFFTMSVVSFRAPDVDSAVSVYRTMAGAHQASLTGLLDEIVQSFIHPLGQGMTFSLFTLTSRVTHLPEVLLYLAALVLLCTVPPNVYQIMSRGRPALTDVYRGYAGYVKWRPNLAWAVAVATLLVVAVTNMSLVKPFIYFQF